MTTTRRIVADPKIISALHNDINTLQGKIIAYIAELEKDRVKEFQKPAVKERLGQ